MTQAVVKEKWSRVQDCLQEAVGGMTYNLYLKNTLILQLEEALVEIGVPNLVVADYLKDRYDEAIRSAVSATLGFQPERVKFTVNGHLFRSFRASQVGVETEDYVAPQRMAAKDNATDADTGNGQARPPRAQIFKLNTRFTLESFVVGDSNRVAFNCAVEVASNPGTKFNPLFIYGETGMGKTHLLQGIARHLTQSRGHLRTLYLSSEYFVNQFVGALRQKDGAEKFRDRFRNLDVLILDDVEFFAGKEKSQQELLHTLQALENTGRQVLVATQNHPKDCTGLSQGLISRFLQGMVAQLGAGDAELRRALIKAKLGPGIANFQPAAINFIVDNMDCNMRELEGNLNKLMALQSYTRDPVTTAMVKEALKDFLSRSQRTVSLNDIENLVISHFGVSTDQLNSHSRKRNIATARQVCMYLARTLTQNSLKEIGRFFGDKNHTTVVFAFQKVEREVSENPDMRALVEQLRRHLVRD